jgi:hypothetical protein
MSWLDIIKIKPIRVNMGSPSYSEYSDREIKLLKMLKLNLDSFLKDTTTTIDIGEDEENESTQYWNKRSHNNIYSIIDDLMEEKMQ